MNYCYLLALLPRLTHVAGSFGDICIVGTGVSDLPQN